MYFIIYGLRVLKTFEIYMRLRWGLTENLSHLGIAHCRYSINIEGKKEVRQVGDCFIYGQIYILYYPKGIYKLVQNI